MMEGSFFALSPLSQYKKYMSSHREWGKKPAASRITWVTLLEKVQNYCTSDKIPVCISDCYNSYIFMLFDILLSLCYDTVSKENLWKTGKKK